MPCLITQIGPIVLHTSIIVENNTHFFDVISVLMEDQGLPEEVLCNKGKKSDRKYYFLKSSFSM